MQQQSDSSVTVDLEELQPTKSSLKLPSRERSRQPPRISDCSRAQHVARCAWHSVLENSATIYSVCCRCDFAVECYGLSPWCKIFWTPTSWSKTCVAVRHSLFTLTLSMRLRGSSWFLLRWAGASDRPPTRWFSDKRLCDNFWQTEKSFGHGQEDDVSVMA